MKTLSPFVLASVAVHVVAFLALGMLIGRVTGIAGRVDGDPDRVFVLVVCEEERIAVAPTPSPVDSPASVESKKEETKKEPEVETTVEKQEVEEKEPPQERPEILTKEELESPFVASEDLVEEIPEPRAETVEEKKPKKEQEDSAASDPRVASAAPAHRSSLGQELHDFQSKLLAALRQSTFFPQKALQGRQHGQVTVAFTVDRSGTVTSIRVVISSGSDTLDHAAREIIRKASKSFPHFPACIREEILHYTVPIYFKERRSHGSPRKR